MRLEEIGKKIKELRKEKGLTQDELAKRADITRVTLGKLERGYVGAVSIKTLDMILQALDHQIEIAKKDSFGFGIPIFGEMDYE